MNSRTIIVLLALQFFVMQSFSQINPRGVAPGILYPTEYSNIQEFSLLTKAEVLKNEDELGMDVGLPYRVGVSVPVYSDLFDLGQWEELPDGSQFFRAVLRSPGAKAISVAFDRFYIPENAQLFFYDSEKENVFGGYTHEDNHSSMMFPGPVIYDEVVIIEYVGPENKKGEEKVLLQVMELAHFYRPISTRDKNNTIGASEDCHVNINCPEGDEWQDAKRGIARMLSKVGNNYGWCSGSLINNTSQDGTPYFITANHCGGAANAEDRNLWQFRFNFERPDCENTGTPANQTLTGCSLVASSPMEGGSDMQLLKLNFTPPPSYNPFYNGWDRSVVPGQSGVGIHHPAGDLKKISTFSQAATTVTNPVISGIEMAENSAWNIRFVETESGHGVTEGGSSGSPMFNQEKLIVGTLTGGNSSCSFTNGNNVYGKINYHWNKHSSSPSNQLEPWLDPLGTKQLSLGGLDPYPFPAPDNLQARLEDDYSVTLTWEKPKYEISDSWFAQVATYSSVRHDTPERAVIFDLTNDFNMDTFYLKRISHLFWEHPLFLWGNNTQFTFKVYESDGATLLHESDTLEALRFLTTEKAVIYELPQPIALTNAFYIAVVPLQSGQPSSLAQEVQQPSNSRFGSAGNWSQLSQDGKHYELLINVYGSEVNQVNKKLASQQNAINKDLPNQSSDAIRLGVDYESYFASIEQESLKNLPENKAINHIINYNIYRDDEIIATIPDGDIFTSYIDTDNLTYDQTYHYQVSAIYNLNPENPNATEFESKRTDSVSIRIRFFNLALSSQPVSGGLVSNEGSYTFGQLIPLKAIPNPGYEFVNWTLDGVEVSNLSSFEYSMPATDNALVANFAAIDYKLSIIVNPETGGTVIINPMHQDSIYNVNNEITLMANATEGYEFLNWRKDGAMLDDSNPLTFDMPASDLLITARFIIEDTEVYTLNLTADPDTIGASLYGAGNYIEGEEISIAASTIDGFVFHSWEGSEEDIAFLEDPTAQNTIFTMPANNVTLSAQYIYADYLLIAEIFPLGSGSIVINPAKDFYNMGDIFEAKAIADPGYEFVNWTIDGVEIGTDSILNYVFTTNDIHLRANFQQIQYSLSLIVFPQDAGVVTVIPDNLWYVPGTEIGLTAIAEDHYKFVSFLDGADTLSTDNEFTLLMPSRDLIITAYFEIANVISQVTSQKVNVFPNPAANHLVISSTGILEGFLIMDITGKILISEKSIYQSEFTLNLSSFQSGIYIIRLFTDDGVMTRKLHIIR